MSATENNKPKEPSVNDYLWDGSGTPDPEIQRLESLLSEFRHQEQPLPLSTTLFANRRSPFVTRQAWIFPRLAAAAVLLLAFGAGIFFALRPTLPPLDTIPGWNVSSVQGAPQIGSQFIGADRAAATLHVGQTLTTDSTSRALLTESDLGQIQVDPNSRLRLLESGPNHKRVQLDLGTIRAYIWAGPTQFVVDTPSAVAIDLGCAYTLQVAADGSGTLQTTLGWVGFHHHGRDSFIPAGAMCSTRPGVGPGTPYFEDASPAFREALANFDAAPQNSAGQGLSLSSVLAEARARDALTLWHLLPRTGGQDRAQVYDRLVSLVPPPPGINREGLLELDPKMLDLYWNALHLGDISIWRYWEQSSAPEVSPPHEIFLKKDLAVKKSSPH